MIPDRIRPPPRCVETISFEPPCALIRAELIFISLSRKDFFSIQEGIVQIGKDFLKLQTTMLDLKIESAIW
jgi:hypothetical protein